MVSVRNKVSQDDEAVFSTLANEKLMKSISSAVGMLTNKDQKRQKALEDKTLARYSQYYPEPEHANTLTTRYKRILNANLN